MGLNLKSKIGGKGGYTGFLFNNNIIIVVGSALLFTPIVLGAASRYTAQAGNRLWAYLLILSFLLFLLATFLGQNGILGAIATGAALGVLFNAILSTQFGGKLAQRLSTVGSG